jgi:uncharacterized membrane protein YhiD involved in acid resistance
MRLQPVAVIFCDGIQILIPLNQFQDQQEAKSVINQISKEKNANFYITAGMSRNNHPFDASQDQFWLNIIINNKDKISYIKLEMHLTRTSATVLKREVYGINEEKEVEAIKKVFDQEESTDAEIEGDSIDN